MIYYRYSRGIAVFNIVVVVVPSLFGFVKEKRIIFFEIIGNWSLFCVAPFVGFPLERDWAWAGIGLLLSQDCVFAPENNNDR
jgi:hypothetical protein